MGCSASRDVSMVRASVSGSTSNGADVSSFREACCINVDVLPVHTSFHARRRQVSDSNLVMGVDVGSLSYESLTECVQCAGNMGQDAASFLLKCKDDILGSSKLTELVKKFIENNSKTLRCWEVVEEFLKEAKDTQLLVSASEKNDMYSKSLEELMNFIEVGDHLTKKFLLKSESVYVRQKDMLDILQEIMEKHKEKLKRVCYRRKASKFIFVSVVVAVLISSILVAAMAAPSVAAVLSAAFSIPIGSVGKWVDSRWEKIEKTFEVQRESICSMQLATGTAINDLNIVSGLIKELRVDIISMFNNAEWETDKGDLRFEIPVLRKLGTIKEKIEGLRTEAAKCSSNTSKARDVVAQKSVSSPKKKD